MGVFFGTVRVWYGEIMVYQVVIFCSLAPSLGMFS